MNTQFFTIQKLWPALLLVLGGCIGTDILEEIFVPERIEITRMVESLEVGTSFTFEADYFDTTGSLSSVPVVWRSSNDNVISINENGEATAVSAGSAVISAAFGAATDNITVEAGETTVMMPTERSGTFRGLASYRVEGMFTLAEEGGNIVLSFNEDFTASNGPGLYVYLSNNEANINGALEVGSLQANSGTQSYTISGINVNTFDYCLIYCKPFGVAFGTGQFE